MRISLIETAAAAALLMLIALPATAQTPPVTQPATAVPMLSGVDPGSGKVGDTFVVQGEHLDEGSVAALYLTDGKNDTKVVITSQNATSITFTLQPGTKAGRFALMILTKGKEPRYVEEPVKLTVEGSETPAT